MQQARQTKAMFLRPTKFPKRILAALSLFFLGLLDVLFIRLPIKVRLKDKVICLA
jgi:hypothetical protein